eukprot:TRINITY_DN37684_c0_g1_i1.p1 TRINITY_DN37684_c0_g1~~TRINITY_DN37684_c0_g1_i1.p1  ORF type:complete len:473 (-),score=59.14 TRINITY_DN37684_c0_g1_i1:271-1629(-)
MFVFPFGACAFGTSRQLQRPQHSSSRHDRSMWTSYLRIKLPLQRRCSSGQAVGPGVPSLKVVAALGGITAAYFRHSASATAASKSCFCKRFHSSYPNQVRSTFQTDGSKVSLSTLHHPRSHLGFAEQRSRLFGQRFRHTNSAAVASPASAAQIGYDDALQSGPVGLYFFSDSAFKCLRDQFVDSVIDEGFELRESYIEDLCVNEKRTAGGAPVYLFKTQLLLRALEEVAPGEVFVISDVDIQFLAKCMPFIRKGISGKDLCVQREFTGLGVNIGFMAIRRTEDSINFWRSVLDELPSGRHDQRIVNNLLYGSPVSEQRLRWGYFPPEIWASSQAYDGGCVPSGIALHHANWIIRNWRQDPSGYPASDPSMKLEQLLELRLAVQKNDVKSQQQLVSDIQKDPDARVYHRRTFGDLRAGPEWTYLPARHPARPGGSRRKKRAQEAAEMRSELTT